jgi:hypothetical protein
MPSFPDCQILDVVGSMRMFAGANIYPGADTYRLAIAAPQAGLFKSPSGMSLVADLAISNLSANALPVH